MLDAFTRERSLVYLSAPDPLLSPHAKPQRATGGTGWRDGWGAPSPSLFHFTSCESHSRAHHLREPFKSPPPTSSVRTEQFCTHRVVSNMRPRRHAEAFGHPLLVTPCGSTDARFVLDSGPAPSSRSLPGNLMAKARAPETRSPGFSLHV